MFVTKLQAHHGKKTFLNCTFLQKVSISLTDTITLLTYDHSSNDMYENVSVKKKITSEILIDHSNLIFDQTFSLTIWKFNFFLPNFISMIGFDDCMSAIFFSSFFTRFSIFWECFDEKVRMLLLNTWPFP